MAGLTSFSVVQNPPDSFKFNSMPLDNHANTPPIAKPGDSRKGGNN